MPQHGRYWKFKLNCQLAAIDVDDRSCNLACLFAGHKTYHFGKILWRANAVGQLWRIAERRAY
jgi:hypothetical protein